jgi:hypothetical protein
MCHGQSRDRLGGMTTPTNPKNTTAFYAQAAISFGLALFGTIIGELYLPVDGWTRAFLALATLFLVTSSFTLAKCVRDQQESGSVISRLDQARLERLLAEFDPFRSQSAGPMPPVPAPPLPSHYASAS